MHQSIATIDHPEFINLQQNEICPMISNCEIKVLYVGENRNHSFITKEVASEMAKTLRGAPIVGYYKESKEDFADHGEKVTFDDEGIHFECMTKPYGFVAPNAEVWFQKFEDTDDFGNKTVREYLMTTGFLWTGQFEECADVINSGKPQSMELDADTIDGHWSTNPKNGMDFFIINDAIFSKLCILGDDVEPCFEGASITAPEVSKKFSLDNDFKKTLYTMVQDLQTLVSEGGQQMFDENTVAAAEDIVGAEEPVIAEETQDNTVEEEVVENQNFTEETSTEETSEAASEFKKDEEEEKEETEDNESSDEPEEEEKDEEEEDKKKYELLQTELAELQTQFSALKEEYDALVAYKKGIEDAKKDELIKSFYMLSDEDKKEVIENKSNYSYEDIEARLSVICWKKKVSFEKEEDAQETSPVVTYNLESDVDDTPAWIRAVRDNNNID